MGESRMNVPKGPDMLCSDKDDFMKVPPGWGGGEGAALPEPRWLACLPFPPGPPPGAGHVRPGSAPGGTSLPLQKTLMSITLCLTVPSECSWKHVEMTWSSAVAA
uniref:Uncharacterized protein n=1 Tax=Rangifer tarandus platyrhynchus TaxID=3082113 RepID=A0ACB0EBI1_RANTA|nr:unnamed protein product [Rangifer tarandus platyrhynchus]